MASSLDLASISIQGTLRKALGIDVIMSLWQESANASRPLEMWTICQEGSGQVWFAKRVKRFMLGCSYDSSF
jgi:hypothetical protein